MAKKRRVTGRSAADEPRLIEWDEIGSTKTIRTGWLLKLTPGLRHTVRLFHRPIKFWRLIEPGQPMRIIREEAAKANPMAICRYAINVIDRSDQQIRILEGPESLFLELRRCYEITGIELGGDDAFDVAIEVAVNNGNKTYRVSFDVGMKTPFRSEEMESLRMGALDLSAVFRCSAAS